MDAVHLVLGYASAGVAVLPLHGAPGGRCTCGRQCATPGKHPRLAHGVHDATTDLGVIAEWLARWPADQVNWGGQPPQGVVVLDVDPRNGGDVTLAALEAELGALPRTLQARTGSGGTHYWFSYRGPARGKIGEGLDVKKVGGYVVMPPSIHASGGAYTWVDQAPAAPAPRWLKLKLNPPITRASLGPTPAGGDAVLVAFILASPEGQRNSRYYWACCRAVENGSDLAPLIDAAEAIGLPRPEAEATAESATHAPQRRKAGP